MNDINVSYNNNPHSTLNFKTPNQVHRNLPNSSREVMYRELTEIQEDVAKEALEGHMKYLKVLEKKSDQLYNKTVMVEVGQNVMVLAPKCAKNRISVMKHYLGAAVVESRANNVTMFYVRWLHNGQSKKVSKDQVSKTPYPNQYFFLILNIKTFSYIFLFLVYLFCY